MHEIEKVSDDARMFAVLAYGGMFVGMPLFILPLALRKDAFSIHHAKQAAEAFGWMLVCVFAYLVISFVTCGVGSLLFPIVMLPYIPTVHGLILALNNDWGRPIGTFGLADSMLSGVQADPKS